ncbi:MAG: 50S ribosomal protein L25 [Verrucomicrobiae bacterium]|nr:50S ribosomal protein L25 [Verrucomicrobiae bacterium]MCP5522043.1 50S ribosomal protein L25 [Verrucomicrobiales bacterium]
MKAVPLTAYPRTALGRNQVKHRRSQGRVPAVMYGHKVEARSLEVGERELGGVLHHSASEVALIDLTVDGDAEPHLALIKAVQHHPLSRAVIHVDFQAVDANEPVVVVVPVETVGEAPGVKSGGVLERIRHDLEVRALPRSLPEVLEIDVSGLQVGDSITVADLKLPEGIEVLDDAEVTVILVAAPKTESETTEAPTEGGESAEPEVIARKKDEAEGED